MRPFMRPLLACLLLGLPLVLLLAAPPREPTPKTAKDFKGATAHKVLRVVDGDTVVVSISGRATKVRLIGVDTPETVHPSKPVEYFGKEASAFTKKMLTGKKVFIEYDQQKQDRYGRTLAYLYRSSDAKFINLEIIKQGYGFAYTRFPFRYLERFRGAQREAREKKRGLWGSPSKVGKPATPSKADPKGVVYITRKGKKYHRGSCRYLRNSKIAISLDKARKSYGPCRVCKPPR